MGKIKKTTKVITKETIPPKKNKINSNLAEADRKSNATSLILPILCITIPIVLFTIISLLVLKIDYNINEILRSIFSSISDEEIPYDRLKYLKTIIDLNTSAFSNNMTFLVYNLLSTLLLSAGGFILYRTLEYKQEIKGLIKANKSIKEQLDKTQNKVKKTKIFIKQNIFYDNINTHLDMAADQTNMLVLLNYEAKSKMSKKDYETSTEYITDIRDSIVKLFNKISAIKCKKAKDFPFVDENQANLVVLKMQRISSLIKNTPFEENMTDSLEQLIISKNKIESWKNILNSTDSEETKPKKNDKK